MMADPNFRVEELTAIAFGYTKLLQESADMLLELKDVLNVNGLSMTDSERMDIITRVHDRIRRHRDLVSYYTRKNISVSYLRAKKTGDTDRVMALYGNTAKDTGNHGTVSSRFRHLHQILRSSTLNDAACGNLAGIAKGLQDWSALSTWCPCMQSVPRRTVDVYPLLRPFAIGLCIMFFPSFVLGILIPLCRP
jgi:hypothetical protein